jgi:leucine dehydrogenase
MEKMKIFEYMKKYDYENIYICNDNLTGLKAVIAIHDTTLGPAAGGCRMWTYEHEIDAIFDAMKLARAMTYKYAAAGRELGGGKLVIIGDPKKDKSEALFRAVGRFIERLGGIYLTGTDVGTDLNDMVNIYKETRYVVTLPRSYGGAGDISPATAFGVVEAMQIGAKKVFGSESLNGLKVAVQGLGKVGSEVVKLLFKKGAKLIVCDIDPEKVSKIAKEYNIKIAEPEKIYEEEADVFSPNALGGILNFETIPKLKAKLICGGANNQLESEAAGDELHKRGILYLPDYVVNSGGTVYDTYRLFHNNVHNHEFAMEEVETLIKQNITRILEISENENIPTYLAADRYAEERIRGAAETKTIRIPQEKRWYW